MSTANQNDSLARDRRDDAPGSLRRFRAGALSLTIACSAAAAAILGGTAAATPQSTGTSAAQDAKTPATSEDPTKVEAPLEYVVLRTNKGDILLELDRARAPISVRNFMEYVNSKYYDGTIFHRVIDGFMVQGGGFGADMVKKPTNDPIKNEWTNGLKNKRGTIAMARTADPDSATAQFYINVTDNPALDAGRPQTSNAGYAVFGRVVSGMETVDVIRQVRTGTRNGMQNVPVETVTIEKAREIDEALAKKTIEAGKGGAKKPSGTTNSTSPKKGG